MHSDEGRAMSFQALIRVFAVGLLLLGGWAAISAPLAWGQEITRRTRSKVVPAYPELAQRMKITGVVRVQVTVSPDGSVKEAKLMGGHPVLASAAMDAIKKWRYEPGPESTGIVEFRFDPNH
jgi:TonB family protein